jgi:hypothetical protein
MTTYTIGETVKEIENRLENCTGSSYFTYEVDSDDYDKDVEIRVSNHGANHYNNKDKKTISFVTSKENKYSHKMLAEYLIVDGYSEEYMTIEECLDFELN